MYLNHFGFNLLPFENVPDPVFFYDQGQYNEIMNILTDSVTAGRGLTVLVGPIGSGKTTISQQLWANMVKSTRPIWLAEPPDSFDDLVALIAEEIGIVTEGKSRLFLLRDIRAKLLAIRAKGLFCMLIVDECHRMSKNVLEGIRVLTNLEKGATKLLQIILIGQEEFLFNLNLEEMRPLKQRISTIRNLEELDHDKSREYILHRLALAGGTPDIFSDHALNMICLYAGGVPRVINSFCHHSLRVTCEDGKFTVAPEHVNTAAKEVGLEKETFHYLLNLRRSKGSMDSEPPADHVPEADTEEAEDDEEDVPYSEEIPAQHRRVLWPALTVLLLSVLSLFLSTRYYAWKIGL